MTFKRLMEPSGEIVMPMEPIVGAVADAPDRIVRRAILVHSGPNGQKIELGSSDGAIAFDEQRIRQIVDKNNLQKQTLIAEYGGPDKMPIGAHQPILDQHSDDSNDRIRGRLTGQLQFEILNVPKVGQNVACAVCEITFLGEEAVKQVLDGRIYHLSVGIGDEVDEDSYNTLGEVSTVIEPAAPGAMLLKAGKKLKGEAMADKKKLEARKARLSKLSKATSEMKALSAKLVKTAETTRLARRQGDIASKMKKLSAAGKISPAEYKKMDFKKLASLDDAALGVVLGSFEALEPKVQPGQKGTSQASNFSDMGKQLEKSQLKKLKSEIRGDLKRLGAKGVKEEPAEKDLSGIEEKLSKKMASEPAEGEKKELSAEGKHLMDEVTKCLEAGDVEKAKDAHAKLAKHLEASGDKHLGLGDEIIPESPDANQVSATAALQEQVDELTTQVARVTGMVEEVIQAEVEEGETLEDVQEDQPAEESELEGEEDEGEAELSAEEKEKKEKELADKKAEEEKKLADDAEKEKVKKELGASEGEKEKEKDKNGKE